MARNELYTFRRQPQSTQSNQEDFKCIKLDRDFNPTGEYIVTLVHYPQGDYMTCACFAGSKNICRHRTMLQMYLDQGKVDSGALYDFDKDRWVEGPKQEEL